MAKYIDADKLIGQLHDTYFYDGEDRSIVYKAIEEQPTADVRENVRGKWLIDIEDMVARCDQCGEVHTTTNFCPNCGADMRSPLDIRDCDHCKHYVTRDGQTGCEKWECEFEKEE